MATEDIGSLVVRIETNLKNFETGMNNVSEKVDGFGSKAKKLGGIIAGAFAIKAVVDFGKESVKLASDLTEVQNVVDTVFKDASKKIDKFATDAAAKFGMSELSAKKFTSTMGAMLDSMGLTEKQVFDMSTSLTGLAGDFASFYNLDAEDAFNKLRSGISGETEPLKQLGINMSVANLETFALTQGMNKQFKEMTQAEQATLRYQYIIKTTANAQGDFAKTSGSFANQQRILSLQFDTLKSKIGEALLPVLTQLSGWFIDKMPAVQEATTTAIGKIQEFIKPIYETVMPLLQQGFKYFTDNVMPLFSKTVGEVSSTVLPLITSAFENLTKTVLPPLQRIFEVFIKDVLPNLISAYLSFVKGVYPIIVNAFNYIVKNVLPPLIKIFEFIATEVVPKLAAKFQEWIPKIVEIMQKMWNLIKIVLDLLVKAFEFAWPAIQRYVKFAVDMMTNTIGGLLKVLSGVIDFVTGVLTGDWKKAWEGIKQIFLGVFEIIKARAEGFYNIGKNLIQGLINGMSEMVSKVIQKAKDIGNQLVNTIKNVLGIHSPSKVTQEIGKFVALGLANGIDNNIKTVKEKAQKMAEITISVFEKMGDAITTSLRKKYQEQQRLTLGAFDAETAAKIKTVQDQINAIDGVTEAEEKALEESEYQKRLAAITEEINTNKDAEKIKDLQQEKADMITEYERKKLLEQREIRKNNLNEQIRLIEENATKEREAKNKHFEALLTEENLQAEARKLVVGKNNKEIVELLKAYNPQWQNAGQSFGESLLNGLNSTKASIQAAVNGILSLVDGANDKGIANYIVKAGDTLSKIAKQFDTTVAAIAKANNITNANKIATGQQLKIPKLATGTNFVPFDTMAMIHKGEAVVPADNNPSNPNANNPVGGSSYSFEGMFKGAVFNVRSDNDAKLIAREIFNLQQGRSRAGGVIAAT